MAMVFNSRNRALDRNIIYKRPALAVAGRTQVHARGLSTSTTGVVVYTVPTGSTLFIDNALLSAYNGSGSLGEVEVDIITDAAAFEQHLITMHLNDGQADTKISVYPDEVEVPEDYTVRVYALASSRARAVIHGFVEVV